MLSRSSSTYQPLSRATGGETATATPSIPRRNLLRHSGSVRIQTNKEKVTNDGGNHEMTSFAIINQHPLQKGTAPAIAPLTLQTGSSGVTGFDQRVDMEKCLGNLERRRKDSSWNWTNFHFVMCIGVVGFIVFWFILLCKMYLPVEYQFWVM